MNNEMYYPLQNNAEIIKKLFGKNFLKDIVNDKLNISECIAANEYLSEYLYGLEISNLLKLNDVEKIKDIVKQIKSKYKSRLLLIKSMDFNNIGMLVVRPENVGLVNEYIKFLNERGLLLIYKKKMQISFEQYLLMYHHGLILKESRYDFPTRTLNYINKDCYVLLFYSNNNLFMPISDYLTSIKGKQGKKRSDTLRGGLAYNKLKAFVKLNGTYFSKKEYNLPFDPIGMCRLLVREEIESDNSHNISDLKLLYYVGQAVHVPNSKEIKDDFSVLFDDNDLDYVKQKIKKIKK